MYCWRWARLPSPRALLREELHKRDPRGAAMPTLATGGQALLAPHLWLISVTGTCRNLWWALGSGLWGGKGARPFL